MIRGQLSFRSKIVYECLDITRIKEWIEVVHDHETGRLSFVGPRWIPLSECNEVWYHLSTQTRWLETWDFNVVCVCISLSTVSNVVCVRTVVTRLTESGHLVEFDHHWVVTITFFTSIGQVRTFRERTMTMEDFLLWPFFLTVSTNVMMKWKVVESVRVWVTRHAYGDLRRVFLVLPPIPPFVRSFLTLGPSPVRDSTLTPTRTWVLFPLFTSFTTHRTSSDSDTS